MSHLANSQKSTDWSLAIGTGLMLSAGVMVVATLVEDFFTFGVGAADDPVSFAAAAAVFGSGLALYSTATVKDALPKAKVAAHVQMASTVELAR